MARSLDSPPSQSSPRRDSPRVAPYLTHEATHHGQVTLVPPQNAGRIRRPKEKSEPAASPRRREREEPRFNTSVPSSARRTRTTSARIPRHPQAPHNQVVEVRITRDSEIPEYPPPSFQEAILTPPVPPDAIMYTGSSNVAYGAQSSSQNAQAAPSPATRYHLGADLPSAASSPIVPSISQLHPTPTIAPLTLSAAPSPLPQQSALPPPNVISQSQHSPLQNPSLSHTRPSPIPNSPLRTPLPTEHGSSEAGSDSDSDTSSTRFMTPEPSNHWEEDRRKGLPLAARVQRERLRLEATEPNTTSVSTPRPAMATMPDDDSPLSSDSGCTHLRTRDIQPLDVSKVNDSLSDDHSDEPDSPTPRTPQNHLWRGRLPSHFHYDSASLPCSPSVATTPVATPINPWSSSLTLSSNSLISPTKPTGLLKRKETVIFRKLFGAKGKDRETSPEPEPTEEPLETWEVVDPRDLHTTSFRRSTILGKEQTNTGTQAPSPANSVFLNRPVRAPNATPHVTIPAAPCAHSCELHANEKSSSPESSPDEKSKSRKKPPLPPSRKVRQSPSVVWKTAKGDSPGSPIPPPPAPSDTPTKQPFPSSSKQTQAKLRAASTLTPLTMPRAMAPTKEAGPPPANEENCSLQSASGISAFVNESASISSGSPPESPTTPPHHYPGRPLPQVPYDSSPAPPAHVPLPPSASPPAQHLPHVSSTSSRGTSAPSHNGTRSRSPGFSNLTELDVLASRIAEEGGDGRNYEDTLLLSEFVGPGQASTSRRDDLPAPFVGKVEVQRRRILKDGRVKLKLTLMGAVVDRCGICLSQFKDQERAALCVSCQKACHERCLGNWLARSRTCPLCRAPLDVSQ